MEATQHICSDYAVFPQYTVCGYRKTQPEGITPTKGSRMAAGFDIHSPVPFEIARMYKNINSRIVYVRNI